MLRRLPIEGTTYMYWRAELTGKQKANVHDFFLASDTIVVLHAPVTGMTIVVLGRTEQRNRSQTSQHQPRCFVDRILHVV